MTLGLPQRIESKISPEPNSGCWLWTGGLRDKKEGYGGLGWGGKSWRSHRLVYTLLVGPIPAELDIDHKCRNRLCCNPEHLEAVTRRENILRGEGIAAARSAQTHCNKGHELTPENTYIYRGRNCRACHKAASLRYVHKKNAK